MKNYVQDDETIPLTAPDGGAVAGNAYLIGSVFGVAQNSADAGAPFELRRAGVVSLPKTTGEAWTEGQKLYFDPATKKLTSTPGALKNVALAAAAAANLDATGAAVILPLAL